MTDSCLIASCVFHSVFRVRDRSGKPTGLSSGRGLAATPPGSKPHSVDQLLIAVTPPGSNAQIHLQANFLTPEGSQQLAPGRRPGVHAPPPAFTTPVGSQPHFRVLSYAKAYKRCAELVTFLVILLLASCHPPTTNNLNELGYIDTTLLGYQVGLKYPGAGLSPDTTNEIMIDIPDLDGSYMVYTKTHEGSIQIGGSSGSFLITPTSNTEQVALHFLFTLPDGRREEAGHVQIDVKK